MYDKPTLLRVIEIFRQAQPSLVLAPSPTDYVVDHDVTSKLAKTAAMGMGIPNVVTPGVDPKLPIPHLYYCDPFHFKNDFGEPIQPHMIVNISSVFQTKKSMLETHASQRSWLDYEHQVDDYIIMMEKMATRRGEDIGVAYGEGVRQHLGYSYPNDNLLGQELGDLMVEVG